MTSIPDEQGQRANFVMLSRPEFEEIRQRVSPAALGVFTAILVRADYVTATYTYGSLAEFAGEWGITAKRLRAWLTELEEQHLIIHEPGLNQHSDGEILVSWYDEIALAEKRRMGRTRELFKALLGLAYRPPNIEDRRWRGICAKAAKTLHLGRADVGWVESQANLPIPEIVSEWAAERQRRADEEATRKAASPEPRPSRDFASVDTGTADPSPPAGSSPVLSVRSVRQDRLEESSNEDSPSAPPRGATVVVTTEENPPTQTLATHNPSSEGEPVGSTEAGNGSRGARGSSVKHGGLLATNPSERDVEAERSRQLAALAPYVEGEAS